MDATVATKLRSLMLSEDYEDWLHAWALIRENMPAHITTFEALDAMLDFEAEGCSVNDMVYELDEELVNIGLDDRSLRAKRAELARCVYTNFPEETALNLGNFRAGDCEFEVPQNRLTFIRV